MSTFTPGTTDGVLTYDPAKVDTDGAANLWRFFGSWAMGKTVWKDQAGNWHETIYPYQGGQVDRIFRKGVLISQVVDSDVNSLANASRVYEGGHVHRITAAEKADLVAGGFASRINQADVEIPHWETEDLSRLTQRVMSVDGSHVAANPTADSLERASFKLSAGTSDGNSGLRSFWTHEDTDGWTDSYASTTLDPANYAVDLGGGGSHIIAEQGGLCLRYQQSGGIQTGISVNNNIFFLVPFLNVGVWKSNLDGTGFASRQVSLATALGFPYNFDVELIGNIIKVREWNGASPPAYGTTGVTATLNLDTDVGDAGAIPTPVGAGINGLVVAHLGTSPLCAERFGATIFRRRS